MFLYLLYSCFYVRVSLVVYLSSIDSSSRCHRSVYGRSVWHSGHIHLFFNVIFTFWRWAHTHFFKFAIPFPKCTQTNIQLYAHLFTLLFYFI